MAEHGTISMYKGPQACRCEPCREAWSAYGRNRTKQKAFGRWQPYVDTARACEHLQVLRDSGMGARRISELSGVAHPVITRIRNGRTRQIRPETEQRILSVQAGAVAGGARVEGVGASRRLQALVALGWTAPDLAARSELSVDTIQACIVGATVTARTVGLVKDLYDRMWDQAPPESTRGERSKAQRARARARRCGWALPLEWDNIDDPEESPWRPTRGHTKSIADPVAVERAINGEVLPLNQAEIDEVIRIGTEQGWSSSKIARLSGRSARQVIRRKAAACSQT